MTEQVEIKMDGSHRVGYIDVEEGHNYVLFVTIVDGFEADKEIMQKITQRIEASFERFGATAEVAGFAGLTVDTE